MSAQRIDDDPTWDVLLNDRQLPPFDMESRLDAAAERITDMIETITESHLCVPTILFEFLKRCDIAAYVAYTIVKNPEYAERLTIMPPDASLNEIKDFADALRTYALQVMSSPNVEPAIDEMMAFARFAQWSLSQSGLCH